MSTGPVQLRKTAVVILALLAGVGAFFGIVNEKKLISPCAPFLPLSNNVALAEDGYRKLLSGNIEGSGGAIEAFQGALCRAPASPYRWCDLGEAYLAAKHSEAAYYCIRQAVQLGPEIPPILMRASNVCLREGNLSEATRYSARVLKLVSDYDQIIFASYDRSSFDITYLINQGLPPDQRAFQAYFLHLLGQSRQSDLHQVWEYGLVRGYWDDHLADQYASDLVRSKLYEQAETVWSEQIKARDPDFPKNNRVFNGGFELDPMSTFFDWHLQDVQGVKISRDTAAASGKWSLRVDFQGLENLSWGNVFHNVVVTPGDYRIEARIRTEGITTDQGIFLRVLDAESGAPLFETEHFTGTHNWTTVGKAIHVEAKAKLLTIQLVRSPSLKFDNKIAGTLRIDSVSVAPLASRREP